MKTPSTLCFRVDGVIPAQIGSKSLWSMTFDGQTNDQMMDEHLALIDEICEQAAKRDEHYRKLVEGCQNAKIKPSTIKYEIWSLEKKKKAGLTKIGSWILLGKDHIGSVSATIMGVPDYKILKEKF